MHSVRSPIAPFSLVLLASLLLAACASAPSGNASQEAAATQEEPAEPAIPRAALSTPKDGAATVLYLPGVYAQAEIASPGGVHVYIDVADPFRLATKPGPGDLLCTTHDHSDHRSAAFERDFPGKWIHMEAGETVSGDVRIVCIPSAHEDGDPVGPGVSTNYLFYIETGGLRILHTGDIGQTAYSDAQKAAFSGRIDVLLQQFSNGYSSMSAENGKGFVLLEDLRPRIAVPLHSSSAATKKLLASYPALFDAEGATSLSASALPGETTALFEGYYPAREAWSFYGSKP